MNTLFIFLRNSLGYRNKFLYTAIGIKDTYCEKSTKSSSSSSSSSESSSDLDVKKTTEPKISAAKASREESLLKLNSLLKKIIEEDVVEPERKLNLAQPTNKRIKKESDTESIKPVSEEKQIVNAVKEVAQDIGGDVKQTESELLQKLLGPSENSTLSTNLSDIMKGMKIDRESKPAEESRANQVRNLLKNVQVKSVNDSREKSRPRRSVRQQQRPEKVVQKIDLFGSESLGIFTNRELKEGPENKTWQSLYKRDLKLAVTHPPANYFQQMILWTEQGKLWRFPIDNEQGLDEEKKVYFTEHIFLEEHLEPWCPPKGPIRHFMDLVCVGLSKNPYLSVQAKREHIEWYKNYFEDKKKLLQEVGALLPDKKPQKSLE